MYQSRVMLQTNTAVAALSGTPLPGSCDLYNGLDILIKPPLSPFKMVSQLNVWRQMCYEPSKHFQRTIKIYV